MNKYSMERPADLGKLVIVSGPGGTGASTIAKILAQKWNLQLVDAGGIMRNKTQLKHLSSYLENQVTKNPLIDKSIDQFMVKLSYFPNMLIAGKAFAAIATTMGIPCTIRIWIIADMTSRVHRILEREGKLKERKLLDKKNPLYIETRDELMKRQSNDIKRWRKLYNVDLNKPEEFNDLVIDTTKLNVPFTVRKIFEEICKDDKLKKRFSPKDLRY